MLMRRKRRTKSAAKYLTLNPSLYENYKRYVSSSEDCQMCSQASTFTAKRKKSSLHQRFVLRSLDQDLFEEMQTRMRDPVFRQKLSERMWKIEGLFAEAKQNHVCLGHGITDAQRSKFRPI